MAPPQTGELQPSHACFPMSLQGAGMLCCPGTSTPVLTTTPSTGRLRRQKRDGTPVHPDPRIPGVHTRTHSEVCLTLSPPASLPVTWVDVTNSGMPASEYGPLCPSCCIISGTACLEVHWGLLLHSGNILHHKLFPYFQTLFNFIITWILLVVWYLLKIFLCHRTHDHFFQCWIWTWKKWHIFHIIKERIYFFLVLDKWYFAYLIFFDSTIASCLFSQFLMELSFLTNDIHMLTSSYNFLRQIDNWVDVFYSLSFFIY